MTFGNRGRINICKFIHQAVLKNSGTTLVIYSVSEMLPSKTHGNINIFKSCRRSRQVRQSCHIRLWSKRWALVSTKRHFWFIGLFGADPPINLLKLCKTKCAKNVEGITKTVIRAPREYKKRNWWFQFWPEIVESITKIVISEFSPPIPGDPRRSPEPGHGPGYGTYLLHAPGTKMT